MKLRARIDKWKNAARRFDEDEVGASAIDVVMIAAVAAIILGLVIKFAAKEFWPQVRQSIFNLLQ